MCQPCLLTLDSCEPCLASDKKQMPPSGAHPRQSTHPGRGLPTLELQSSGPGLALSLAARKSRATDLGEAPPLAFPFPSPLASWPEPSARKWHEGPALPNLASGGSDLKQMPSVK